MNNKNQQIINFLDETFPNVGCALNYNKDYELVIAVMLSAQTTDKAVNTVTEVLFSKYDSLEKIANAPLEDVENIIKKIGMYKLKAQNVIGIANKIINDFNGVLPNDKELLQTLPGVGNKTAGVIRCEIFKIPDFPVDTHILRIAHRLKYRKENEGPFETEQKLKKSFPKDRWIRLHHQLIHFGRNICTARNPKCEKCKIVDFCRDFKR
jgi:endonuclease-3